MADSRNSSRRASSPKIIFRTRRAQAFHRLRLKHKKCAPPRPRCVYMPDRCASVLVERGDASIYGSLTHHFTPDPRDLSGVFAGEYRRRRERDGDQLNDDDRNHGVRFAGDLNSST
ncbi:hypothetical protein P5V15_006229 [Pogonomyrmex californicus]